MLRAPRCHETSARRGRVSGCPEPEPTGIAFLSQGRARDLPRQAAALPCPPHMHAHAGMLPACGGAHTGAGSRPPCARACMFRAERGHSCAQLYLGHAHPRCVTTLHTAPQAWMHAEKQGAHACTRSLSPLLASGAVPAAPACLAQGPGGAVPGARCYQGRDAASKLAAAARAALSWV